MFDMVSGLPVHALVVHAVVVLLPMAAVGAVAVALVPRWRRAYAPVVALLATVATALVPVATRSGLALAARVGPPEGAHQQLGGQLLWFALALTVAAWLLVLVERRGRTARTDRRGARHGTRGRAVTVVAALTLVAALAAGFQVYRVGDSGARSVWSGVATTGQAPNQG